MNHLFNLFKKTIFLLYAWMLNPIKHRCKRFSNFYHKTLVFHANHIDGIPGQVLETHKY